jgi:Flp pilus assembly protein TadD
VRRVHHRQAPLTESGSGSSASMMTAAEGSEEEGPLLAETDQERARDLSRQGTAALLQGRLPDAIRLFREATLAHPGNATAWRGLGLANERLGRGPEAVRAYQRYLRVAPHARDAEEVRGRIGRLGG